MSHTKGPWNFSGSEDLVTIFDDSGDGYNGGAIATIKPSARHDIWERAHLIAAAPEMLGALQAMEKGFADGSIQFTTKRISETDPYHPANLKMNTAISKAKEATS